MIEEVTKVCMNRQKLFQGFVISDWQGIDRITTPWHANYTYSVLTGIQAGIDMVSPHQLLHCFRARLAYFPKQEKIRDSNYINVVSGLFSGHGSL